MFCRSKPTFSFAGTDEAGRDWSCACWMACKRYGSLRPVPPPRRSLSQPATGAAFYCQREALATQSDVGTMDKSPLLTTMDRIYLAIIISAVLLLFGAASLYITRTADLSPHVRTIGLAGPR